MNFAEKHNVATGFHSFSTIFLIFQPVYKFRSNFLEKNKIYPETPKTSRKTRFLGQEKDFCFFNLFRCQVGL
jgi:hypothetical protein